MTFDDLIDQILDTVLHKESDGELREQTRVELCRVLSEIAENPAEELAKLVNGE